jgi:hypothetical protein
MSGVTAPIPVYVFRDRSFAPQGDTVVSVAPRDAVVSVYGGGGVMDGDGLCQVFGGSCAFRNEDTGAVFMGVWGARNASRFRAALRRGGVALEIVDGRPPARLIVWSTSGARPARQRHQLADEAADPPGAQRPGDGLP